MTPTCQFVERALIGRPKKRLCGKPATHTWTPRSRPDRPMPVCSTHGHALAGNWHDELTPLDGAKRPSP
jgi:hypothetical protein